MYVIIASIILTIKSYIKNIEKNILLACTANVAIARYIPNFCISFLSFSFILGLKISIIAININDVIKKLNTPLTPKPINVPTSIKIYKIPIGILLLHAVAKIASPKGASSLSIPTIETKKAIAYKTISLILINF